jgi:Cytochrome P450
MYFAQFQSMHSTLNENLAVLCVVFIRCVRSFVDLQIDFNKIVFADEQLLYTVINLLSAGTETTTTSLLWSFIFMIKYPEIQRKCQEEIDANVGRDRAVRLADKGKSSVILHFLLYTAAKSEASSKFASLETNVDSSMKSKSQSF